MKLGDLKELIEDLERMEGEDVLEKDVFAEHDYGDHCHTRALVEFRDAQVLFPHKTAYSNSGLAIPKYPEDEEGSRDGLESVVVLTRECG